MNNLERIDLISSIAEELQKRMTFRDIDAYLPGFGVDITKPHSGANSKWVYTKEMLADAPPDTVIAIADELKIPHHFTPTAGRRVVESTFWRPNTFHLFLSHISEFKEKASALQAALIPYGISSFVAHVDIEPTKQWLDEIEAALLSMDALAALLFDGFKESNWTDQEVGAAVGRGVLILPRNAGAHALRVHGAIPGPERQRKDRVAGRQLYLRDSGRLPANSAQNVDLSGGPDCSGYLRARGVEHVEAA